MLFDDCLTKKISLVLISSSLVLSGCHYEPPNEKQREQAEKEKVEQVSASSPPVHTNWWYFHHNSGSFTPGHMGSPHFSGSGVHVSSGGVRSGFTTSRSVSVRGGFGSAGHSFGGTGA